MSLKYKLAYIFSHSRGFYNRSTWDDRDISIHLKSIFHCGNHENLLDKAARHNILFKRIVVKTGKLHLFLFSSHGILQTPK